MDRRQIGFASEQSIYGLPDPTAGGKGQALADGQDHVEVVVVDEAFHLSAALGLNYSPLSNRCVRVQLAVRADSRDPAADLGLNAVHVPTLSRVRQRCRCG